MKAKRYLWLVILAIVFCLLGVVACNKPPETEPEDNTPGEDGLISVVIFRAPSRTDYYVGEVFDPSGMIIKATYEDGKVINVLYDDCTYNTDALTVGDREIVISFGSKSAKIPITVSEAPQIEDGEGVAYVTGIRLVSGPDKDFYVVGEHIDLNGIIVNLVYSDETERRLSVSQLTYVDDALKLTDTSFTVSYEDYSVSFPVTVSKYAIRITNDDHETYRMEAEAADLSTIRLVGWAAGRNPIESNANASGSKILANLSSAEGYVEYGIYSEVDTKVTLYAYCAAGKEAGTTLNFDASFTLAWNGSPIQSGAVITTSNWSDFQKVRIGCVVVSKGENTIRLTRKGACPNFDCIDFEVNNPEDTPQVTFQSIEVTTPPNKTEYIAGETFDPTGMVVTATRTDGDTQVIPNSNLTYSTAPLTADTTQITFKYGNMTTTVDITVTEYTLDSISVTTQPAKTKYIAGETFDPTGMVVEADYGTTSRELAAGEYEYTATALTDTTTSVTISFGGKSTTVDVIVAGSTVQQLIVQHDPDRTMFVIGETFNPAGMVIAADYGKTVVRTVPLASLTYSTAALTSTDTSVRVSYGEQHVDISIFVSKYSIRIQNDDPQVHRMEAEAADLSTLTQTAQLDPGKSFVESSATASGGKNICNLWAAAGYIEYGVYSEVDTKVTLYIYCSYATGTNINIDSAFSVMWNGDTFTSGASFVGKDWPNYVKIRIACVQLVKGENTLRLTKKGTCPNFDCVDFDVNNPADEAQKILSRLEITTQPNKLAYFSGQSFDPTGMVVTAVYNDSTTPTVPHADLTYSTAALTAGTTEIEIGYGGKTVTVDITVTQLAVTGLTLTSPPDRTSYITGQAFDPTGMVITATYNDGTTPVIQHADLTYNKSPLTTDISKITVSFGGQSVDINITVVDLTLQSIALTTAPTKTDYYAGETFDPTGMVITATYSDGSTPTVPMVDLTYSTDPLTAGTTQITVSFGGKSVTVNITVVELTGLTVETAPTKTEYRSGEAFDPTGMVIKASVSVGEPRVIPTSDLTYPTAAFDKGGSQTVTVQFLDKSVDIPVTVKHVVVIADDTNRTYHYEAEDTDLTTMHATPSEIIEKKDTSSAGAHIGSLWRASVGNYLEYYFESAVACKATIYLSVAFPYASPLSEKFNLSWNGYPLTTAAACPATGWNDFTLQKVICVMLKEGENVFRITKKASSANGGTYINIDYIDLIVNDAEDTPVKLLSGIEVTTQPTKTEYVEGQSFDPAGLVITATFDHGAGEAIDISDLTYSTSALALGTTEVTVSYGGKSVDVGITVIARTLSGIAITTPPTKTDYYVDEVFDPTGMVITATYNDGTTPTVPHADLTYSTAALTEADTEIVISYGGKTVTVQITVTDLSLTNLELTTAPTTTVYYAGESFDTTGMVITATFGSGTTSPVDHDDLVYSAAALTAGATDITVGYGGKTVTVPITVKNAVVVPDGAYKTYRYEAESTDHLATAPRRPEYPSIAVTEAGGTGTVLNNLWARTGYLEYCFVSSVAMTADIYMYASYSGALDLNTSFDFEWNADALTSLPTLNGTGYPNYYTVKLASVSLVAGRNILKLTMKGGVPNIDYIDLAVNVPTLTVTSQPTKTTYYSHETFDPTGMEITATYADTTTETVPLEKLSYSTALAGGMTSVTVSYGVVSVPVPVTVTPSVRISNDIQHTYRFEAEAANISTVIINSSGQPAQDSDNLKESNGAASGGKLIGSMWKARAGSYIEYCFVSDVTCHAEMYMGIAFASADAAVSSYYDITWNDDPVTTSATTITGSWKFDMLHISGVDVVSGVNMLKITKKSGSGNWLNIDYIDLLVNPAIYTGEALTVQAEKVEIHGKPSDGQPTFYQPTFIERLGVKDNKIIVKVYSDAAATVSLSMYTAYARNTTSYPPNFSSLKVNGAAIDISGMNIQQTSSWTTFLETALGNISLVAGLNTIELTVGGVYVPNIDKFVLTPVSG